MATVVVETIRRFGPRSAGTLMTPREFDRADFEEGWRYELIHGVLVVSPSPLIQERDPNEELGRWLRNYQESHPSGSALNATVNEQTVRVKRQRRRVDRTIWAGLGRLPRPKEKPTIAVEFVSRGKRNRQRDYEEKRDELIELGVEEYWIIDRFERTLTVFLRTASGGYRKRVIKESQVYRTPLLPGFELPLARLLALSDRWPEDDEEL